MSIRFAVDCTRCGWTSPRTARPGRAINAHRRHSCDLHRARTAAAQRRAARTPAVTA